MEASSTPEPVPGVTPWRAAWKPKTRRYKDKRTSFGPRVENGWVRLDKRFPAMRELMDKCGIKEASEKPPKVKTYSGSLRNGRLRPSDYAQYARNGWRIGGSKMRSANHHFDPGTVIKEIHVRVTADEWLEAKKIARVLGISVPRLGRLAIKELTRAMNAQGISASAARAFARRELANNADTTIRNQKADSWVPPDN